MYPRPHVSIYPLHAPVRQGPFPLIETLITSLHDVGLRPEHGDVFAISSKYAAISEGRVVALASVVVTPEAEALAARYSMNPTIAQLVLEQADHIFGGIEGFLLTWKDGILSPNAGIDRSNIPAGYAVVFPEHPYQTAERARAAITRATGAQIGVILTDSWLMPGRLGTTGVALATAGFEPVQDERGKSDLFGNPLVVTRRGIADQICAAAELVMGERNEATPFVLVRGASVTLSNRVLSPADTSIAWEQCIYVSSLTEGRLHREG
jgi:coenzyme F420-0:L-glutamate ligase